MAFDHPPTLGPKPEEAERENFSMILTVQYKVGGDS